MKKIWILWGMWPQASLHFYEMLIQKTENMYGKNTRNQDYPYILLSNIPVPDLIENHEEKKRTVEMVNSEAKALERAWADFLVMPCNTMHLFQDEILQWVTIPFLSIIDCVIKNVKKSQFRKIWILGSSSTLSSWIYTWVLEKIGLTPILPKQNEYTEISRIIKTYISWNINIEDILIMKKYCDDLIDSWAEGIILWCTELPLILKSYFEEYHFFASSEILAQETLSYYSKSKTSASL